jgi:hypothetical protein
LTMSEPSLHRSVPPAVQDVLARVDELVPALRARAGETERLHRMHPDTLCDLRNAGVFLLTMSTDVRGYEADDATIADVVAHEKQNESPQPRSRYTVAPLHKAGGRNRSGRLKRRL